MYKSEINRYQQHNKVLKTQIKSLQDEQKKFRNCIGLLKSNLKDELISVPQNKLEVGDFWLSLDTLDHRFEEEDKEP